MIHIFNGDWIVDLKEKTCRNIILNIVVEFKIQGMSFESMIRTIPMELLSTWAAQPDGEKRIKNIVMEAEKIFIRAYFENELKKQGLQDFRDKE
jgi:hypothetical protein